MAAESPDAGFEARVREQAAAAIEDELGTEANGEGSDADPTQNGDGVPPGRLDTAREVAETEGYTRMDFMQFQADLTGRGWSRDDAQAAWHTLRDEGVINGDGDGNGDGAGGGGGGTDRTADPPQPTPDGPKADEEPPDSVDELEARVRSADAVFLIVQPDCPTCGQAKEALSEWIDEGMVDVLNIQESDKAVDIAMAKELAELPALIVEDDDEFRII